MDFEYESEIWLDEMAEIGEDTILYDSQGNPVKLGECIFNWTNGRQFKSVSYINDILFTNTYDDNGNIIDDENNHYVYNDYGQLISSTGLINSSYTYDSRGNILSKTVDGDTTEFSYNSDTWKDQLTAVNGIELTYDANGNLTSYGDTQYTWSHGKSLESITDGENTYSYKYDENGIRVSKTVNGTTTDINTLNGVVLAQKTGNDIMYFQYDSTGTPVGFVYNDVQYLYITNQNEDVMGIADADGTPLVEYAYDEWGKLLTIYTADEDNEEQISLAEANPFRYRGYYYDNETGYYYLQSRYYDPELCRFISADRFAYINTKTPMSINAYAYCLNNPIKSSDPTGQTPQGVAVAEILSAILVCYDAFLRAGENFVYLVASAIVSDKTIFYQPGSDKREKNLNAKKWYNDLFDDFIELTKTSFYKLTSIIAPEFFFNFFEQSITRTVEYFSMTIAKVITITFGFGNGKSYFSTLLDAVNGRFQILENGNLSTGVIIKDTSIGTYIQSIFDSVNGFFGSISIDIVFDKINFPPANSGYAVNTEYAYPAIVYIVLLVLGSIFNAGDLQKT